jgi:hypothetical protein
MSHPSSDEEAERHREAAAATEQHHEQPHHHPHHDPSGGGAYDKSVGSGQEYNEATFFIRHRGKLAAGVMVVVAIIFFTVVIGDVHF